MVLPIDSTKRSASSSRLAASNQSNASVENASSLAQAQNSRANVPAAAENARPEEAREAAAAASRAVASESVADSNAGLELLEKLTDQFQGDDVFARQILQVMHETLPAQIEKLQAASTNRDFQQVASIAHQIKGAAGDSCLTAVYQSATELEQVAVAEDGSRVPLTVAALSRRSLETIQLIEDLIAIK